MVDAVIYCRVSTDRQVREGDGLRSQETRCRAFAQTNNAEVLDVFRDAGISGGSADRPGFFSMLDFLKARSSPTLVIIDDLNRLARDVAVHRSFRFQISKNGGQLVCVNMPLEDTPEGQFVETIVAATAELEKEQNKRRVKDRQKARLESGYWVFNNPVGYKYEVSAQHGKLLVPDQPSASIIAEAFKKYSTDELLNQTDVLNFLRDSRIHNSRGNLQKVSLEDVKRILSRPIYAGIIEYPRWNIKATQGKHKALVPVSVYESVQKKLNSRKRIYSTGLESDFPLRGYLVCSGCGGKMTGSWSKGRNGKYPYYRCQNSSSCRVKPKSIARELVESDFVSLLKEISVPLEVVQLAKTVAAEVLNEKSEKLVTMKKDLETQLGRLEKSISEVVQKIISAKSELAQGLLESEVERLDAERTLLSLKLEKLQDNAVSPEWVFERVEDFLAHPHSYWIAGKVQERRLVQSLIFTGPISYSKSEKFGTAPFSKPFSVLHACRGNKCNLVEIMSENWNPLFETALVWIPKLQRLKPLPVSV